MELDNKYKILLADDEPQNIKNLFETLDSNVYRVFVAPNGMSAVELAIKHQPDAIIMDWDMPEMDGIEAIKIIRVSDVIKNIPIIVATGRMTTVENLRTALEAGANDYIRKPYDPIEIEARLNSMIRLNLKHQRIIELEKEIMQKEIDKINREYEINSQALTALKIRLLSNSKFNHLLVNDLQNICKLVDDITGKEICDIISKLKVNINCFNWKEYEVHFEKVHPAFIPNLIKNYPELTDNETELCTYMKLNMTTDEIIALTHKTKDALKKSKQRLKKKLRLDEERSLYEFINEVD